MKYCFVEGCRFNNSHITSRHICGNNCVFPMGHGKVECNNTLKINALSQFNNQVININQQCSIPNCLDKHTHTTPGHNCLYCFKFNNNHSKQCPVINNNNICDNINDFQNIFIDNPSINYNINTGFYDSSYGGMGSTIFFRKNIITNNIDYLFMHSDSWGQYGDDSSDVPKLRAFIHGYKKN